MHKNLFNDDRPPPNTRPGHYGCPGCRCDFVIKLLSRYPHGPDEVKFCPVCQSELNEVL